LVLKSVIKISLVKVMSNSEEEGKTERSRSQNLNNFVGGTSLKV